MQGGTGSFGWPDVSGVRGESGLSGVQWETGGHWPVAGKGVIFLQIRSRRWIPLERVEGLGILSLTASGGAGLFFRATLEALRGLIL